MQTLCGFLTLTRLGLLLNVAGTIMIAFSFGKNLGEANQEDAKGRKIYLAAFLRPKLFEWGVVIIILGFVLQFWA